MKTYSFIGSDKNAGKTTVLNYVYRRLNRYHSPKTDICLTSIGINGEPIDTYESKEKPTIGIQENSFFITAADHLSGHAGKYSTCHCFNGPEFKKPYILAKALFEFNLVVEGPNDKQGLIKLKQTLRKRRDDVICLIDGSIDRQFIGHPDVSDAIFFSLLISDRAEQQQKARDLTRALTLKVCTNRYHTFINRQKTSKTKTIVMTNDGHPIYRGDKIPFLDEAFKTACMDSQGSKRILYLNGALSKSLYQFLAPMSNFDIVLNNFTLYLNVSTDPGNQRRFLPRLFLYQAVPVKKIFIKQENWNTSLEALTTVPVINLFRDDLHETGI